MSTGIVGARIRERRRGRGLTQAELAQRLGISPSYMNLIERNRRPIAGRLLARAAAELDLGVSELDGKAERRLLDSLHEVSADPRLADFGLEVESLGEMIGRYPGWSRAIGALARAERESGQLARALSDRLNHDPFLGQTMHQVLTHVAALRSAGEILDDVDDLDPDQRRRFQGIISVESRRLSQVAEALAAYFDKAHTASRAVTPTDEVEALFEARANRFDEIEQALGSRMAGSADEAAALARSHAAATVAAIVREAGEIGTAKAAERARRMLMTYAEDAARLPEPRFALLARETGYDIEALARRLGCSVPRVCRRLTAQAPDKGPRFGYVAANAAGALTDLRAIPGFAPSRNAATCPLWVLSRAQQTPERAVRQLVAFPDGRRLVFVARARLAGQSGFGAERHFVIDMIAMSEADAAHTVYEVGAGTSEPEPVGTTCRVCPRSDCSHRVEDPLTA